MRIIAGRLKSLQFKSPRGRRTHPMSEKARSALFNILGDVEGLTMLDAFGGSGGISFEAASRGVSRVICVDSDKQAYRTITENIEKLGLGEIVHATIANVSSWADNNRDERFDIVVCDPPYNDIRLNIIQKLANMVEYKGLLVLSWPAAFDLPEFIGMNIESERNHAGLKLVIYCRTM
jgi:16S rRNA (guanine966-N2)-methyltransferase